MSKHQEQIIEAAKGQLDEQILAAVFAKPRGSTTASMGGVAVGAIGSKWAGKQREGAEAAGIELGNPGAVAITPANLVTMKVKVSAMGAIKSVEQILSTVPLSAVDSLEVKRMGLAGVMEISAGGGTFKLEGKAGDMKEFAEVYDRTRAGAPAS